MGRKLGISALKEMFREEGKGDRRDVEAAGNQEDNWFDVKCCDDKCDKGAFRNEMCFVSLCVAIFQFIKDLFWTMHFGLA